MKRTALALTAAGLLALTGCGGDAEAEAAAGSPATETVTVEFALNDSASSRLGCRGTGGFDEIGAGTQVTVRDGGGEILGAASLGEVESQTEWTCLWRVAVENVPVGEDFYTVEIADRGEITMSGGDLEAAAYAFSVSLG